VATTGVEFLFNNNQAGFQATGSPPSQTTLTVTAIPFVQPLDAQSAKSMSSKQPGGATYNATPQTAALNMILLSEQSQYGFAKNGVVHITLATNVTKVISFLNTTTNATTYAGDTVFANVLYLRIWNLSGLDGVAAANMTIGATAANPFGINGILVATPLTLPASQWQELWLGTAGSAVAAGTQNVTATPTAGGNFAMCIGGN
jgi:hypothetical protein